MAGTRGETRARERKKTVRLKRTVIGRNKAGAVLFIAGATVPKDVLKRIGETAPVDTFGFRSDACAYAKANWMKLVHRADAK